MNRQLNFFLWVLVVVALLAAFTIFQNLGGAPAARSAPQNGAQWLLELLQSWLPFIALIGVWLYLARSMRRGGPVAYGRAAVPADAMLDDPDYWRGRADAASATAERLADLQSKRQMLEIARGYAYLAQRAEERRGPGNPA